MAIKILRLQGHRLQAYNLSMKYGEIMTEKKTTYNGLQFNHRLEARWAVFMDTFSWRWQYKKSYYYSNSFFILHDVTINASPNRTDWILKNQNISIWISPEYNENNIAEAHLLCDHGFHAMTLGKIPKGRSPSETLDDLYTMTLNYEKRTYDFFPAENLIPNSRTHCVLWVDEKGLPIIAPWHKIQGIGNGDIAKTLEAFNHARQARFEWGQNGYINY